MSAPHGEDLTNWQPGRRYNIARMRRQLAIAVVFMAALAPALAQMHGGSRGGAGMGRSGFSSSGARGFGSGSGVMSGPRFSAGVGMVSRQPFHPGHFPPNHSFSNHAFIGHAFIGQRPLFFGHRHFRHPIFFSGLPFYFGYYGYPAYGYGYSTANYDSSYYDPSYDSSYDHYGSAPDTSAYSAQSDMQQQQADINRLEDEVTRLREQKDSPPSPQAGNTTESAMPTVLVFRDKHTQEVQNYAIVGGTLWIFSEQRATKLPLAWLDIEGTTQANDDRGVDFQIPR